MRIRTLTVLACLALVGCCATPDIDLSKVTFSDAESAYLAILMNGQKAGHAVFSRRQVCDRVIHGELVHFELKRGGFKINLTTEDRVLETADGKPLAFRSVRTGAGGEMVVDGRVTPDGQIVMTTTNAGRTVETRKPWPEGAVMSEGAHLIEKRHGYKPGTTFDLLLFTASDQRAHPATMRVIGWKTVDVLGANERLLETKQTMHIGFGKLSSRGYVNADYDVRKMVMPLLGVNVEMVVCPKPVALSPNDPADFLAMALVSAPRPIKPEELKGPLQYTLRFRTDPGAAPLVGSDEQEVAALPDGKRRYRVTVRDLPLPRGVALPYVGRDPSALAALAPNKWLQCDTPEVKALAKQAVGDATDAAEGARRIERFVRDYLTNKNLNIGYATALETLRSREGDCTEHALLVAALCRAAGIPARVACGLARFQKGSDGRDLFGPHAWAQVYLNGRWYSIDAALGDFTSGHLLIDTGAGEPTDFFRVAKVLGNVEIVDVATAPRE